MFTRIKRLSLKSRSQTEVQQGHRQFGVVEQLERRDLLSACPLSGQSDDVEIIARDHTVNLATPTSDQGTIVNGTPTTGYPSVGLIGDQSGFFCSGTLIGSRHVLTAAHCAEGVANTNGRFQVGGTTYNTSEVFVHPNWDGNNNDIAIYRLAQPVTGIAPSPIFRGTPQVGDLLTIVGFGAGGTGDSGHNGDFGTKRVGTTPIDIVQEQWILWNFDDNSESNTAPGDSGGPAFLDVDGVLQLAGVTSYGIQSNAGIGDQSGDVRVDAYQAWIDSIVGDDIADGGGGDGGGDDGGDGGGDGGGETVEVYLADFSDSSGAASLDGFTIDNTGAAVAGLWHLSTGRGNDAGHSGDDSIYFGTGESASGGGNYEVGDTAGRITSPSINLSGLQDAQLSFNYFLQTEGATNYDLVSVQISQNGGAFSNLSVNLSDPSNGFVTATVDLTSYVDSNVRIRFDFDTVDTLFNNYEGWYVDDVSITGQQVAGSNQAPTDISLDNTSVTENTPGAVVGNITVTDPDTDDTHTFVVSDNRFEVVAGQLKLKSGVSLESSIEPTVAIDITVTDSGNLSYNEAFTVTVLAQPTSSGPELRTGLVTGVGSQWTTVTLDHTYNSMVVVATANYDNTTASGVVRIQQASGNSFQVRIDSTNGTTLSGIDVHYMVVEEGVYTDAADGVKMEAVKHTSTITDRVGSWVGEAVTYNNAYTNPVVFGQVMTYNDSDYSVFWNSGASRTDAPNSSTLRVGKHVGEDSDTTRSDETLGYIVFESGSGNLSGLNYTTAVGADIVKGVGNSSTGYNYGISGLATVSGAIVTQAGMDGGNGSWAVLYGNNAVTSSQLTLATDEDQAKDTERNHTTEEVGYIVFGVSTNPPAQLSVLASDADNPEGDSGSTPFTFTISRIGNTSGTTTVNYAVTGSGANAATATDFTGGTLPSGVVQFTDGQSFQTITVNVSGDTDVESDEDFLVMLSGASGNSVINTALSTGTIQNDDIPTIAQLSIAATDASRAEGDSGSTAFTFTVTRSGNTSGTTSVNYVVTGNGANPASASDFTGGTLPSGVVQFTSGQTSQVITVNVVGDVSAENDEGFLVTLSGASGGAVINTATAAGTIQNDDNPSSAYQIDVIFTDNSLTASQQAVFTTAASRWSEIILGDLPAMNVPGIGLVDDLAIEASAPNIDGPGGILGQAGPTWIRSGSYLPSAGIMQFDSADVASLEASGQLVNVILHEMGHVIGIGTVWSNLGLVTGAGTSNPRFTGSGATAAYNQLFGTSDSSVPVANTGGSGTRDAHWRESTFNNELMTGYLDFGSNPISTVTVASLADMGYVVNMAAADPYTPPGNLLSASVASSDFEHEAHSHMTQDAPNIGLRSLESSDDRFSRFSAHSIIAGSAELSVVTTSVPPATTSTSTTSTSTENDGNFNPGWLDLERRFASRGAAIDDLMEDMEFDFDWDLEIDLLQDLLSLEELV